MRKPASSILLTSLLLWVCNVLPSSELAEGTWELVHPWPSRGTMNSIAFGDGVIVVGGSSVVSSEDGVVFRAAPDVPPVASLIWTGSEFVARMTELPRLCFSPNGRAWVCRVLPRPVGVSQRASALAGGGELPLVAVGYGSEGMWTSVRDQLGGWTAQYSGLDLLPSDLCWGDGSFVVVGRMSITDRTGRVASSSDGITWRQADVPESDEAFEEVEWCNGSFFALGSRTLWSSANGRTWSAVGERPIDLRPGTMNALVCDQGTLRVFGADADWEGGWVATLGADGKWAFEDLEEFDVVAATAVDHGLVAVASPYSDHILVETLPGHWRNLASSDGPRTPESAATDGAQLLVVDRDIRRSVSGTSWERYGSVSDFFQLVQWSGDRWLLAGLDSFRFSTDGVSWQELPIPFEKIRRFTRVASHGEHVVVIGAPDWQLYEDEPHVLVSHDGQSWTDVEVPGFLLPGDVCWTGSDYVLVGQDGFVARSPDGLNWEHQAVDTESDFRRVAYGDGVVVAAGIGTMAVNKGGVGIWQLVPSPADETSWWHLIWTGRFFFLYGYPKLSSGSRSVYGSFDGLQWEPLTDPQYYNMSAVTAKDGELLVFSGVDTIHRFRFGPHRGDPEEHHLLPVAVHADGESGSLWRSDLHILSLFDEFLPVWIGGGTGAYQTAPDWAYFQIPQDGQMWREDLLAGTFPYHPPAAPIRIAADGPLLASSRVWTEGESGSHGQRVPVVQHDDLVEGGDEVVLPMLAGGDAFRTNLGFSNFSDHPIEAEFKLFGDEGEPLGELRLEADAGGWTQCTRALAAVGHADQLVAYALVTSFDPDARFFPYASVVDERSNDPSFIAPLEATSESVLIPAAAHSGGAAGTRWRTDLDLVNPGTADAQIRIQLLSFDVPLEQELTLAAGTAMRIEDVVGGLFASEGSVALELEVLRGEVAVASRTFTESSRGSFGQTVPALMFEEDVPVAGFGVLTGLEQSARFRSNLGMVNTSEAPRDVTVQLFHGDGTLIGTLTRTVAPRSLLQLNQAFLQFVSIPIRGYSRVTTAEPGVFAWASVVDQGTGDPVFYPAMAVPLQP